MSTVQQGAEASKGIDLLTVISEAQSDFILNGETRILFDRLLQRLLDLTASEYGFIGEILQGETQPYLKTHAITNIAWNEATRNFYEENVESGLEFTNLKSLFGEVITTGEPVITNRYDPENDKRAAGQPEGHPPMYSFLGLPFFLGEKLIGMVGIANRPSGYDDDLIEYLQPFLTTCASIIGAYRSDREKQDAEDELKQANEDLQRLDKLKDDFLANTSHELRTPLNGIIGLTESLIDGASGPLSDKTTENLAMIASSGRRLASLVNDILDFSQLKQQEITLRVQPLDMRGLTDVVLGLSRPLVGSKSLQLHNDIPADLPLISGDENRLQQIMHNLIGNGIKFTNEGDIRISAELLETKDPQTRSLKVTVADTGVGIAADKFDRIFESFEQAEGSTAREFGGTGLGLTVTRKLVELHGGVISVESIPDEGSKFSFTMPVSTETEATNDRSNIVACLHTAASIEVDNAVSSEKTNDSSARVAVDQDSYQILAIDDEPINLQVLSNHLSLRNHQVTLAQSGQQAVEILDSGKKFDLVILDVMMPRMSGYEVCAHIREKYTATELPVLLLSAKNQVVDLVSGLNAGANDYLTKPIAKEELLARIDTHLNLRKLTSENMRLAAELDVTRRLQAMLLPQPGELSAIAGLDVAGYMEPASEVGGDYYEVLSENGQTKFAIGDVTGHGLESGVLMLMTQMGVRTLVNSGERDPKRFLDVLNRTLCHNIDRLNTSKEMTLNLLDYEPRPGGGQITICGQHETAIAIRKDGSVELIDTEDLGIPLGLDNDISSFFKSVSLELAPGDGVLLYTDGITEAENEVGEFYGQNRLCQVAAESWNGSAENIKSAVVEDLAKYLGNCELLDDVTLMVVKQQ